MSLNEFTYDSLLRVLALIKQFKKQILIISIVIFSIGFAFAILSPFQYRANSSLMPPKQSSSGMNLTSLMQSFGGLGGLGSISGMAQTNLSSVYKEVMVSNSVLNFVIDTLHLTKNKYYKDIPRHILIEILRSSITVLIDKSGIIFLSVTLKSQILPSQKDKKEIAILSAKIANSVILGLDFVIRERNNSVSGKTKDFIGKEIENYSHLLDSIQNNLEIFRKNNKVLELEEQTKAIVLQANTIAVELAKAEVELTLGKKVYSDNSQKIKMLQESYNILRNQYDKIQSGGITQNDEFSIPLSEIPFLLRNYSNLQRDQKLYEQILIYLRTNYYQEAIQEKRDVPQIDVLDWATTPIQKEAPSYKLLLIVFTILDIAIILLYLAWKSNKVKVKVN